MGFKFLKTSAPEGVAPENWNDWTWQLRQSLKSVDDFKKYFQLTPQEEAAFHGGKEIFNVRTTPYYASLANNNTIDPLRRILMPHTLELAEASQALLDPLGEKKIQNAKASRIVHRYSDRALFLITDICSVYCRYCTRKHFTGQDQAFIKNSEYDEALTYLKKTKGIKEVILSGGDPLTVSNSQLEKVLSDLRSIDHVEIIRIGSRMPVVCPQRVDEKLVQMLRRHKPVFMMTHFNHPRELTAEAAQALELFVDHGIPVMNQMVLLNGVNNHPAIVQALSRRLLFLRVKPYYMFQCDPSIGTDHLRTTVEESLEIQRELWGHLSGLAMPTLSLDIPNGGGKTTLVPNFHTEISASKRGFKGWDGVDAEYINPVTERLKPADFEDYMKEWMEIVDSKK